MVWLPTAQAAAIMRSLLITTIFSFLYLQERSRYLFFWTLSLGLIVVRYIALFAVQSFPDVRILIVISLLAMMFMGVFMLCGTTSFFKGKWRKNWIAMALMVTVWLFYAVYAGLPEIWYSTPVHIFTSAIYIYTGFIFIKKMDREKYSFIVFTGIGMVIWGLHKAETPILRPMSWATPWGFVLEAFFELYVAIGLLLINFHKNWHELRVNEQALSLANADLEKRVQERTNRLEESLQELEAFSYSVSHDLRAPLRAISGFGEILEDEFGGELPPDAREYLERIQVNAGRMDELIKDLLMLSQMNKHQMDFGQVDLTQLAQEVFAETCEVESVNRRQIDFSTGETPPVMADEKLMRVVLTNLISNAIKFTRGSQPALISFGSHQEEGSTEYFIQDNGIGFSMEFAERIFLPFQRLHSGDEYEGTGIGLATVRRGIERHNGRVWAVSAEGEGTTIFFTTGEKLEEPV